MRYRKHTVEACRTKKKIQGRRHKMGFVKKLGPLVLSEKITRAEAGELLKLSGDKTALRRKVEELVKAKKLTREQAKELLSAA